MIIVVFVFDADLGRYISFPGQKWLNRQNDDCAAPISVVWTKIVISSRLIAFKHYIGMLNILRWGLYTTLHDLDSTKASFSQIHKYLQVFEDLFVDVQYVTSLASLLLSKHLERFGPGNFDVLMLAHWELIWNGSIAMKDDYWTISSIWECWCSVLSKYKELLSNICYRKNGH